MDADPQDVLIDYTNWRGQRSWRRVRPVSLRFDSNQWHPEPQWLILAVDLESGGDDEMRYFAAKNVHGWRAPGDEPGIAAAMKALAPFAKLPDFGAMPDDATVYEKGGAVITVGDVRRARAAVGSGS